MKTLVPMLAYLTVQMHFICISETFKTRIKINRFDRSLTGC